MKALLAITLALVLSACAHDPVVQKWVVENEPLAKAGTMPWSVYYMQYYGKLQESSARENRALMMERVNVMIAAAKGLEDGSVSRETFENVQRIFHAQLARDEDRADMEARRALAAGMVNMNNTMQMNRPVTCTSTGYGATVNTVCR